jgi:serine protease AprX
VVLSEQANLSGAALLPNQTERAGFVWRQLTEVAERTQKPLLALLEREGVAHRRYYIANTVWVKGNRAAALKIAQQPEVLRVDGNPTFRAIPEPVTSPITLNKSNSPQATLGIAWGISQTRAPDVWAMGYTGQGVVVAGQDTGYAWSHPALLMKYRGWNGSTANHDYNWHDSIHANGGVCGADSPTPCDDGYHGTHTMGTVIGDDGGVGSAGNQIGMAPGATWFGCRNMDRGFGTPSSYLECFEFLMAPYPVGGSPAQGDPAKAPDVTNNSWGCPDSEGCTPVSLSFAVKAHRAAGIFTVASAGNSGSGCASVNAPIAIFDEVYTVGALNSDGTIAGFSSRGPVSVDGSNRPKPDIAAPGVGVVSSVPSSGYGSLSGTSMAGPHVAGAVALLWSARPALKNKVAYTEEILNRTAAHVTVADECGSTGWPNNIYGYGKLDVLAAVNAVPTQTTTITGVVRAAGSLQPVAGALVAATYTTPSLQFGARTDANGVYSISVLPGVYTLTAAADTYAGSGDVVANAFANAQQDFVLKPLPTVTPTQTPTATQIPPPRPTDLCTANARTQRPACTRPAEPLNTSTPTATQTQTPTPTLATPTVTPTPQPTQKVRAYLPLVVVGL